MRAFVKILLVVIVSVIGINCNAQKSSQEGIPLIIVKEQSDGVVFEKISIKKDQTEVIADASVITLVYPISIGKAANFVTPADRQGVIIVKNINNQLNITYRSKDGREKSFPSPPFSKLKTFQIRVNITSGKGYKKAFVIDNYDIIREDDGPVLDIFAGMIPMHADDYSITTETKINEQSIAITGSVSFVKIDEWIVVEAKLPGGKSGKFIVDTGASGGIVLLQSALPKDTEISELKAIAYTGEGQTETKGKMQAAEGNVEDDNFLGIATLQSFEFGNITLGEQQISVLKEFPEFLERNNIIGVIGIKVLKQAEIMRIENINKDKGVVKFMSHDNNSPTSYHYSFSLKNASNLLFIQGVIQDIPIDLLVDIGARRSIIARGLVENNNLTYSTGSNNAIMGLDGKISDAVKGNFSEVMVDNESFNEFPFIISPNLFVTKAMGLEKSGALLGMSFYSKFSTMEIDFTQSKLYLDK